MAYDFMIPICHSLFI